MIQTRFMICLCFLLCLCVNKRFAVVVATDPHTRVIQTINDKSLVPGTVHQNWQKYYSGERILFDDAECVSFLQTHFGDPYVNKFKSIQKGAHKSDLFRYAWLYVNGGIYCDIKTVLVKPLRDVFKDNTKCYLMFTKGENRIYNGIIATPPWNPVMFKLLEDIMMNFDSERSNYLYNCQKGFQIVSRYCEGGGIRDGDVRSVVPGVPDFHFAKEVFRPSSECKDGPDRYGFCTYITDHRDSKMFKVRDPTYPWTK